MIPKKSLIVIVAVVLVAVMLVFTGILPLSFGRVSIESKTQHKWHIYDRFVGNYNPSDGYFELITNPVGGTRSRSAFLLAKTPGGESEFITAQGAAFYTVGIENLLLPIWNVVGYIPKDTAFYRVYHKEAGFFAGWDIIIDKNGPTKSWVNARYADGEWGEHSFYQQPGLWSTSTLIESITFSILGDHPGAIKVELIGFSRGHIFDSWHELVLSSDEAEILPSGGLIERTQSRATYEVGEVMKVRIATDFSGSTVGEQDKGYMVKIRNPDGDVVWTKDLQDDWDGTISVTIGDDWYSSDWDNRYQVELVNQFRDLGVVSFFAIDVLGLAPADCDITATDVFNGKIEGGSSLSVTFTAPEKEGAAEIEGFKYCAFFGQSSGSTEPPATSSAWIQKWVSTDAAKTGDVYTATVSISIPNNVGYVSILGVSIGEGNRASEIITPYGVYVWVDDEPDDDQLNDNNLGQGDAYIGGRTTSWYDWILPGDPDITDEEGISWLGVLIAFLIVIGFAFVGFVIYKKPQMMLIFALVGLVVAVLVYAYFFTNIF